MRTSLQDSSQTSGRVEGPALVYPLGMRGRAVFAGVMVVIVIVIAIRCVPGQPGIINVGSVIPPMPLKGTPETVDDGAAPRPTLTSTPSAAWTPTPTATPEPGIGVPEPLPTP